MQITRKQFLARLVGGAASAAPTMVAKTDVAAGIARTYDIHGTADHSHNVTVAAAMFTMLKANTAVTTTSSKDQGHTHLVTIMCA
jgi:hypothetical protein